MGYTFCTSEYIAMLRPIIMNIWLSSISGCMVSKFSFLARMKYGFQLENIFEDNLFGICPCTFWWGFVMVLCETYIFKHTSVTNTFIWKIPVTFDFFQYTEGSHGSDIHDFFNRLWTIRPTMSIVWKLWISQSSLGILEKFKCHWDLLDINCNCIVLFCR